MNQLLGKVTALNPGSRDASPAVQPAKSRRKLFVTGLVCQAEIGAYESERGRKQRVRADIEAEVEDRPVTSDALGDVVSYEILHQAVYQAIGVGHTNLLETMAERIAAHCLAKPAIQSVRIRLEKLDIFPDAHGAGIEITRARPGQ